MEKIFKLIEKERGRNVAKGNLNHFFLSDKCIYGVTDKDFTVYERANNYEGDSEWFANQYTEVVSVLNDYPLSDITALCSKLNETFNPVSFKGFKLFAPFKIDENTYEIEVDEDTVKKSIMAMSIFASNIEQALKMAKIELEKLDIICSALPVNERIYYYGGNLMEVYVDISKYDGTYESIIINY